MGAATEVSDMLVGTMRLFVGIARFEGIESNLRSLLGGSRGQ